MSNIDKELELTPDEMLRAIADGYYVEGGVEMRVILARLITKAQLAKAQPIIEARYEQEIADCEISMQMLQEELYGRIAEARKEEREKLVIELVNIIDNAPRNRIIANVVSYLEALK